MSDPEKRICVYCGSKGGTDPAYTNAAQRLGELLTQHDFGLVFGGGSIGLMGVIADAVIKSGGEVIGIIPEMLAHKEIAHQYVTRLEIVDSMHTRKARMAELSDYFIAMPGGFGTFEELFETITWAQLGIHPKPTGILNVNGFFDGFFEQIETAIKQEFIEPKYRELFCAADDPEQLLHKLLVHQMPKVKRWVELDEI